jgi:uncharacterized protein with HEPN domain
MRDVLIHDYLGVDSSLVADVALAKVPDLHTSPTALLERMSATQ